MVLLGVDLGFGGELFLPVLMTLVSGGDTGVSRRSARQGSQSSKINRSSCCGQSSGGVTAVCSRSPCCFSCIREKWCDYLCIK